VTENADLVYAGRDRKRPPGASDLVQQIWLLLHDHPEGMTRDQIHERLAEGWLETDAYRMYQLKLEAERKSGPTRGRLVQIYGTAEFKARAQRWYIGYCLKHMARRTARLDSGRWFANEPPLAAKPADRLSLVPLTQIVDSRKRANRSQVARENLKVLCRAALQDKRNSKGHRTLAQEVLDYLSGGTS
jgi:hypothetical protein